MSGSSGRILSAMIGLWVAAAAAAQQPAGNDSQNKPGGTAGAKPQSAASQPAGMDDAAMQAAMNAMQPGPTHERLMKLAGEWEITQKLEMPGQPAMETKGTASIKAALGNRFLQENGTGEMMGMPNQHFKMWGYNNGAKKYEALWTWTLSTGFLNMTGESKDNGKTIEWDASFHNEVGVREEMKVTTTIQDDDHFTIKMFAGKMPDGSAGPSMLLTYARKK